MTFTEKFLTEAPARCDWIITPYYFRKLRPIFTLARDERDVEVWISQTGFRIRRRRRTAGDALASIRLEKVSKRARLPREEEIPATPELKVFAGTLFTDLGEGSQQVRAIIATTSERNIARRLGWELGIVRSVFDETSNATFDAIAMSRPGRFFARPLRSLSAADFREVKAKNLR